MFNPKSTIVDRDLARYYALRLLTVFIFLSKRRKEIDLGIDTKTIARMGIISRRVAKLDDKSSFPLTYLMYIAKAMKQTSPTTSMMPITIAALWYLKQQQHLWNLFWLTFFPSSLSPLPRVFSDFSLSWIWVLIELIDVNVSVYFVEFLCFDILVNIRLKLINFL